MDLSINSQHYKHGLLPSSGSICGTNHCNPCIWLFPQDCPESPTHVDHPAELHFSNILHHPTPVLTAGAHSRLSVATPTPFSPFRSFTPTSAIKAHVQSPAPIRLLSPALNQISLNRTMSPATGRWRVHYYMSDACTLERNVYISFILTWLSFKQLNQNFAVNVCLWAELSCYFNEVTD